MTMYQNQVQEDLMLDFDAPLSGKGKYIQKPSSCVLDEVTEAAHSAKPMSINLDKFMMQFDDEEENFDYDFSGEGLSFLYEKLNSGFEKATVFLTSEIKKKQSQRFTHFMEGILNTAENYVYNLPQYEEELKVVTSACLFFYGGSWVGLASFIAADEIFGTKQVLSEAFGVGWKFLCAEDLDEHEDVAPCQLTDTFKNVGMQFALLLAVLYCNSWAEICVTLAFASKLTKIMQLEQYLDDGTGIRSDFNTAADVEWLSVLSFISCASISLIIFGVWPGFVVAMYMAFVGIQFHFTGSYKLCLPTGSLTSKPYVFVTSEDFLSNRHPFSIWASVAFSALWQAYYSYDSQCQYLSWLMFLLPAVKLFNLISSYFTFDISNLKFE